MWHIFNLEEQQSTERVLLTTRLSGQRQKRKLTNKRKKNSLP
jgi:hypothetical protein